MFCCVRPLTDFGQPPPASSLAALGTPALSDIALSGARHSESVRRRQHTFSMATAAKLGVHPHLQDGSQRAAPSATVAGGLGAVLAVFRFVIAFRHVGDLLSSQNLG